MWLFPEIQYGFRSSRSTPDILTVVSDRIARAFNRSEATWAVTLDISKAFDRVWHAGLLHKLKSYGISGQIFGLISSFLSNRRLRVVLDGKSSQEYPVNAGVPQGSILGPTLFLLYINDLADDVIYTIAIFADDTTFYSKCDQASDLWQQLELASELKSELRNIVDWARKWLIDFSAGKTQLHLFDQSNNTGSTANKGWSMVNYCQYSPFDCHINHVMIIVTGGFSKKSFLSLLLLPRNSSERSWTCFLEI